MAAAPTSSRTLRFALSQGHGGSTVLEGARIFAKVLGHRIGQTVRTHIAPDYDGLLKVALAHQVDLAWMPPFVHIAATAKGCALAVVCERNGALTYRSALIVRADSRFKSVDDLRAGSVQTVWNDRHSAGGYVFPRLYLGQHGIVPARDFVNERFVGSPLAACAAVSDGQADLSACFVSEESAHDPSRVLADLARVYAAAPWRLRVLAVSDAIPSDGIVVGDHLPAELTERLTDVMLGFHTHAEGKDALAKLLFANKLVRVTDELRKVIAALRSAESRVA